VVVHPARAATEQRVLNCEHALRRYRTELTDLDQQLADLRAELAKVEAAPGP